MKCILIFIHIIKILKLYGFKFIKLRHNYCNKIITQPVSFTTLNDKKNCKQSI